MHVHFIAFIDHLSDVQRSQLTIRRYRDVLRELGGFTNEAGPNELTAEVLQRFASKVRTDGARRTAAGLNLRIAVLRVTFSYLLAEGLVTTNPATRLVGLREPRRTPKYLTVGEVRRVLAHLTDRRSPNRVRDLVTVLVLWQTGLRVSELARLTWAQLDPERAAIRDVLVKGGHVLDVALNREALDALLALRGQNPARDDSCPMIARLDGRRLSVRAIEAAFERWRAELGWTRPLHPHVLRHTHATGALALGTDIATVADLLRHSGLRNVTIYAAVQDQARRAALAKLGSLVPREILNGIAANDAAAGPDEERTCVEEPFYEDAA